MVTSIKQTGFKHTALRITPEMHAKLHAAASASGRSYNAEIVARLQSSFDTTSAAFPPLVGQAVKDEMKARGGSEADALLRLVLAAQANGGTIFHAQLTSKTTFHEFLEMLDKGKTIIPKGTPMRFEIVQED